MVPAMTSTPQVTDSPSRVAFKAAHVVVSAERAGSWKDARLRKHSDYQRVYKATRKQFSASMTWFLADQPTANTDSEVGLAGPRVGLTAGKVLGKAHERNRIKRRMREVVRHNLAALPGGVDLILHPRRSVMTMDFVKLDAEVLRIFRQAAGQVRQARASGTRSTVIGAPPKSS
jgi:ribonuclease P protein component